ncbi:uncharacterized protein LOC142222610 [Haematobia irritans]|uniref:uncharacterized protein LOC142222610 n=1 Tax=Haematobia irritans TaxID=7368 RepID=UPI003F50A7FC
MDKLEGKNILGEVRDDLRALHFPNGDCKFVVGDEGAVVLCNRMAFAMASEVFENLLCGGKMEVFLPKVCPTTFRNLRYIICNKNVNLIENFTILEITDIDALANEYNVKYVVNMCTNQMHAFLQKSSQTKDFKNALKCYYFAVYKKDDDFIQLVHDTMEELQKNQNVTPVNFFNIINQYFLYAPEVHATEEKENKTRNILLKNCLELVPFGRMTFKDFIEGPGKSSILSSEMKYKILSKQILEFPSICNVISQLPTKQLL